MRLSHLLVVVSLGLVACEADPEKCEKAVRNYASLVYWKSADDDIAKAAPEAREPLRKDKLAEFQRQLDRGMPTLVSQCQTANNTKQIDCMIAAKTFVEARDCADAHE